MSPKPAPLHNLEAEQTVIAGVLWDNAIFPKVRQIVTPGDFADAVHGRIFEACGRLLARGEAANVLTLKRLFDTDGALAEIGGAGYLAKLANQLGRWGVFGAEDSARAVLDLAQRRRAIDAMRDAIETLETGQDTDPASAHIANVTRRLIQVGSSADNRLVTKRDAAIRVVEAMSRPPRRFATGLPGLDRSMGGGLWPGKSYGMAARMKVGKTALLGTISHNLDRAGQPHLFLAGEMTAEEIEMRNIARSLDVSPMEFLRDSKRRYALALDAAGIATRAGDWTLYGRAAGASLDDVLQMASIAVLRHGIIGIIVDYWQLVGGKLPGETEEWHLRQVAERIAAFCRRHGIWSIIAAQINQDGNTRGGEGLKLACDQYYRLHRELVSERAWMEMQLSRYTPYLDVGTEMDPGLMLRSNGPWFEDVTDQAA